MKVADFDFELPDLLIAQQPAHPRDSAWLLHVGEKLSDFDIGELPGLLSPGDLMVFNNTKVIPSRLTGTRVRADAQATVEVTLHKLEGPSAWWAFARPAKRLKPGDTLTFSDDFAASVTAKRAGGEVLLAFNGEPAAIMAGIERHGVMPLPPYIKRPKEGAVEDRANYQTLFAERDGAVAAPTAGLHFTLEIMAALEARGVATAMVTLHVGAGTFLPIKVADTDDHIMHAEWGEIDEATATRINQARVGGGRIVAVGSTSLRLLETAAEEDGTLRPFTGETDIFITPGYRFKLVDRMFTNFHLPKSTLFMLVSAFAGHQRMSAAYAHAIGANYRFFSYGDACLLEKADGS